MVGANAMKGVKGNLLVSLVAVAKVSQDGHQPLLDGRPGRGRTPRR